MRFLMIDKILELKEGETATGVKNPSFEECSLPGLSTTGKMPRTLILEAIGQLAAWLIMVTRDFEVRPIIASFGKVEFTGDAEAGDQLVIQVDLKSLHDDAALVEGEARVGDKPVARVSHAVCTFVPVEMYDETEEIKARYRALIK
jgi:3-hydroxyacyl-[acyl-carrier-protein] dehydratase